MSDPVADAVAAPATAGRAIALRTIDCPRCNTRHYLASRVTECVLCGHPFQATRQQPQQPAQQPHTAQPQNTAG